MFGSCKSISGKYSIFRKCYFLERKMFSFVWLHFKKNFEKYFLVFERRRKRQTQKNTDKTQIDARRSTGFDGAVLRKLQFDDCAVNRDLAKHRATSRDRDRREGEIAISRSVDHDLAKHRADRNRREIAIDGAGACERRGLELGACVLLPLALSLSLSLFLSLSLSGIHLK